MTDTIVKRLLELSKLAASIPVTIDGWSPVAMYSNGKIMASRSNEKAGFTETVAMEPVGKWKDIPVAMRARDEFQEMLMTVNDTDWNEYMAQRGK